MLNSIIAPNRSCSIISQETIDIKMPELKTRSIFYDYVIYRYLKKYGNNIIYFRDF